LLAVLPYEAAAMHPTADSVFLDYFLLLPCHHFATAQQDMQFIAASLLLALHCYCQLGTAMRISVVIIVVVPFSIVATTVTAAATVATCGTDVTVIIADLILLPLPFLSSSSLQSHFKNQCCCQHGRSTFSHHLLPLLQLEQQQLPE